MGLSADRPPAHEGEVRVYRMEPFGYMFLVMTVAFTVFAIAYSFSPDREGPIVLFYVTLAWFWLNILLNPFRVRLWPNGEIEFRALARRPRVNARDVTQVRVYSMSLGMVFVHRGGKIWVRAALKNFFDLLTRLRELNPQLEIRS